jgi:hypothetical protein
MHVYACLLLIGDLLLTFLFACAIKMFFKLSIAVPMHGPMSFETNVILKQINILKSLSLLY